MVLQINYYYILGPIAGIAILLPYVGVIFSTVPAVAVAYFQYDGRKALARLRSSTALLQFLEGNVLTPLIVGGKVRLFPLTVMVAFIFWGLLWGIPGAVLAVPLTSAIKVVCENVTGWEGFARLLGEPDPPPRSRSSSLASGFSPGGRVESHGLPRKPAPRGPASGRRQRRRRVEEAHPEDRRAPGAGRARARTSRRAVSRVEQAERERAAGKPSAEA